MKASVWDEAAKAIEKAEDSLENAEYNLKGGYFLAAANRAYYSCFYCMVALLYTEKVFAKTHQGVKAKFSEHFIKTGAFPPHTSAVITDLLTARQEADYDFDAVMSFEEAEQLVGKAKDFLRMARDYFIDLRAQEENAE